MNARHGRGRRALAAWLIGALCAVVGAAACGSGSNPSAGSSSGAATATAPAQPTLVVIGDNASAPLDDPIPVGQTWPQFFFRNALSRNTVFVNLSVQVASARFALQVELPQARQLHPTVAAILLGFADINEGNSAADFGRALDALITGVRGAGAHTVLVGTLPHTLPGAAPYNAQIAAVARNDAAVLVNVAPLPVTFVRNPSDFVRVPDAASQREIGDAFTAAYRAATSAPPASPASP
ncbi:MAG TPA: hypothetical protein VGO03_05360 [Acidimicrobiia bacterium]|jgi:hypothetical protein